MTVVTTSWKLTENKLKVSQNFDWNPAKWVQNRTDIIWTKSFFCSGAENHRGFEAQTLWILKALGDFEAQASGGFEAQALVDFEAQAPVDFEAQAPVDFDAQASEDFDAQASKNCEAQASKKRKVDKFWSPKIADFRSAILKAEIWTLWPDSLMSW